MSTGVAVGRLDRKSRTLSRDGDVAVEEHRIPYGTGPSRGGSGDAVRGPEDAAKLLDIEVQQIARARRARSAGPQVLAPDRASGSAAAGVGCGSPSLGSGLSAARSAGQLSARRCRVSTRSASFADARYRSRCGRERQSCRPATPSLRYRRTHLPAVCRLSPCSAAASHRLSRPATTARHKSYRPCTVKRA